MTQAQSDKFDELMERYNEPNKMKEEGISIEIVDESVMRKGSYIGFFWGQSDTYRGIYIGIELDGYAHS
jgi:hypothetical protein